MSLPTPHIQALSSYKVNRRESTILRNISSPFSLAIPPRAAKPKQRPRSEVPLRIRPPSGSDDEIEDSQNDEKKSQFLQVPKRPKKAVLVFEKPIHPDDSLYELETDSNRTASSGSHGSRQSTLTRSKIADTIRKRINDRIIALAVTLTLAVLLAIGIPLGVILPQKYRAPLPINILLPLYMDPADGAWHPLNDQIVKHHDSQFTIIINPAADSSNITHPSKNYLESLKTLTAYPNVCVVGYIDTNNGQRANASVRADVMAYAAWSKISNETALHGVYFDHTPWEYDKSGLAKAYLHNVSTTARDTHGWAGGRSGLVMQNPGRIPDARLVAGHADMVVVFDGMYGEMQTPELLAGFLQESKMTRDDLAMVISQVPNDLGRVGMRSMIEKAKKEVEWFYLTDAQDAVGSWFPSFFGDWLDVTF